MKMKMKMKKMKVTGQVPGETKEIRVKVKKEPRTTINIPCTLIKEGPRKVTLTLHVEEVKDPIVPKTVRVRTITSGTPPSTECGSSIPSMSGSPAIRMIRRPS